jgi:hypothetical protein
VEHSRRHRAERDADRARPDVAADGDQRRVAAPRLLEQARSRVAREDEGLERVPGLRLAAGPLERPLGLGADLVQHRRRRPAGVHGLCRVLDRDQRERPSGCGHPGREPGGDATRVRVVHAAQDPLEHRRQHV